MCVLELKEPFITLGGWQRLFTALKCSFFAVNLRCLKKKNIMCMPFKQSQHPYLSEGKDAGTVLKNCSF